MRVNIDKTEEVSDEQRKQIASVLDQKVSKRQALRDEMKEFIWAHGASWESDLIVQFGILTGAKADDFEPQPEEDDELDLIGATDEDLDDLEDLI